jgi:hypothetical protein
LRRLSNHAQQPWLFAQTVFHPEPIPRQLRFVVVRLCSDRALTCRFDHWRTSADPPLYGSQAEIGGSVLVAALPTGQEPVALCLLLFQLMPTQRQQRWRQTIGREGSRGPWCPGTATVGVRSPAGCCDEDRAMCPVPRDSRSVPAIAIPGAPGSIDPRDAGQPNQEALQYPSDRLSPTDASCRVPSQIVDVLASACAERMRRSMTPTFASRHASRTVAICTQPAPTRQTPHPI